MGEQRPFLTEEGYPNMEPPDKSTCGGGTCGKLDSHPASAGSTPARRFTTPKLAVKEPIIMRGARRRFTWKEREARIRREAFEEAAEDLAVITAKCEQYWNERQIDVVEMHAVLRFIHARAAAIRALAKEKSDEN